MRLCKMLRTFLANERFDFMKLIPLGRRAREINQLLAVCQDPRAQKCRIAASCLVQRSACVSRPPTLRHNLFTRICQLPESAVRCEKQRAHLLKPLRYAQSLDSNGNYVSVFVEMRKNDEDHHAPASYS
ncbi:hypothetical protein L798_02150 [Zootermopsis nevadensis]|uniref:Uncharacterized protein n=1 Tax=Zootermopsis nevadensis TaxID=136037 RepID=A0A067RQS2_ZOONE|nr:hypothetical protein L798_02150 [Zootermopsis nevadensis]